MHSSRAVGRINPAACQIFRVTLTVCLLPGPACERKNAEAVRILVQYNADTNHRCNRGWTALHESVSRNDLEAMEILVSGGAKVEAKNVYSITPLFVAAQSGQLEALRFLAKHGEWSRDTAGKDLRGQLGRKAVLGSSWGCSLEPGPCRAVLSRLRLCLGSAELC